MKREDIIQIIKQVFVGGFGAVLALTGAGILVVCSLGVVKEVNYPAWLIAGIVLFSFGSVIYVLEGILNGIAKMRGK